VILPDAAVGSIIAAAIAGLVVFISTVLTKEQKTSEFRQVWIDELRKDISQFIAGVTEVVALHKSKVKDEDAYKKFLDDNFKVIQELETLSHRIVLRLNPDEHSGLVDLVKNFRKKMLKAYQQPDRERQEEKLTKELLDATKKVLSSEWKRVKQGEPTFRLVKKGGLVTMVTLFLALVVAMFVNQDKEKKDQVNEKGATQIIQYVMPTSSSKPVAPQIRGRSVRMPQIQNNTTIIEMPATSDCTQVDKCREEASEAK
jgi:uncharacterized protein YoxC